MSGSIVNVDFNNSHIRNGDNVYFTWYFFLPRIRHSFYNDSQRSCSHYYDVSLIYSFFVKTLKSARHSFYLNADAIDIIRTHKLLPSFFSKNFSKIPMRVGIFDRAVLALNTSSRIRHNRKNPKAWQTWRRISRYGTNVLTNSLNMPLNQTRTTQLVKSSFYNLLFKLYEKPRELWLENLSYTNTILVYSLAKKYKIRDSMPVRTSSITNTYQLKYLKLNKELSISARQKKNLYKASKHRILPKKFPMEFKVTKNVLMPHFTNKLLRSSKMTDIFTLKDLKVQLITSHFLLFRKRSSQKEIEIARAGGYTKSKSFLKLRMFLFTNQYPMFAASRGRALLRFIKKEPVYKLSQKNRHPLLHNLKKESRRRFIFLNRLTRKGTNLSFFYTLVKHRFKRLFLKCRRGAKFLLANKYLNLPYRRSPNKNLYYRPLWTSFYFSSDTGKALQFNSYVKFFSKPSKLKRIRRKFMKDLKKKYNSKAIELKHLTRRYKFQNAQKYKSPPIWDRVPVYEETRRQRKPFLNPRHKPQIQPWRAIFIHKNRSKGLTPVKRHTTWGHTTVSSLRNMHKAGRALFTRECDYIINHLFNWGGRKPLHRIQKLSPKNNSARIPNISSYASRLSTRRFGITTLSNLLNIRESGIPSHFLLNFKHSTRTEIFSNKVLINPDALNSLLRSKLTYPDKIVFTKHRRPLNLLFRKFKRLQLKSKKTNKPLSLWPSALDNRINGYRKSMLIEKESGQNTYQKVNAKKAFSVYNKKIRKTQSTNFSLRMKSLLTKKPLTKKKKKRIINLKPMKPKMTILGSLKLKIGDAFVKHKLATLRSSDMNASLLKNWTNTIYLIKKEYRDSTIRNNLKERLGYTLSKSLLKSKFYTFKAKSIQKKSLYHLYRTRKTFALEKKTAQVVNYFKQKGSRIVKIQSKRLKNTKKTRRRKTARTRKLILRNSKMRRLLLESKTVKPNRIISLKSKKETILKNPLTNFFYSRKQVFKFYATGKKTGVTMRSTFARSSIIFNPYKRRKKFFKSLKLKFKNLNKTTKHENKDIFKRSLARAWHLIFKSKSIAPLKIKSRSKYKPSLRSLSKQGIFLKQVNKLPPVKNPLVISPNNLVRSLPPVDIKKGRHLIINNPKSLVRKVRRRRLLFVSRTKKPSIKLKKHLRLISLSKNPLSQKVTKLKLKPVLRKMIVNLCLSYLTNRKRDKFIQVATYLAVRRTLMLKNSYLSTRIKSKTPKQLRRRYHKKRRWKYRFKRVRRWGRYIDVLSKQNLKLEYKANSYGSSLLNSSLTLNETPKKRLIDFIKSKHNVLTNNSVRLRISSVNKVFVLLRTQNLFLKKFTIATPNGFSARNYHWINSIKALNLLTKQKPKIEFKEVFKGKNHRVKKLQTRINKHLTATKPNTCLRLSKVKVYSQKNNPQFVSLRTKYGFLERRIAGSRAFKASLFINEIKPRKGLFAESTNIQLAYKNGCIISKSKTNFVLSFTGFFLLDNPPFYEKGEQLNPIVLTNKYYHFWEPNERKRVILNRVLRRYISIKKPFFTKFWSPDAGPENLTPDFEKWNSIYWRRRTRKRPRNKFSRYNYPLRSVTRFSQKMNSRSYSFNSTPFDVYNSNQSTLSNMFSSTTKSHFKDDENYELNRDSWSRIRHHRLNWRMFRYGNKKARRWKFRPGIQRRLRIRRQDYREEWGIKLFFQKRLTRYFMRWWKDPLYYANRLLSAENFVLSLSKILLYSKFLPDTDTVATTIKSHLVAINGHFHTSLNSIVLRNDLIQMIIHAKYYIIYKWTVNWSFRTVNRIAKMNKRRPVYRKVGMFKKPSRRIPNWIFNYKNKYRFYDIYRYLEVDYFTMSSFVIYDPWHSSQRQVHHDPISNRPRMLRLYNWRYIT